MSDGSRVGGVVLLADGVLRFVPAAVALRVASPPRVTPVPGTPPALVGVTLQEGVVLPVLSIGSARGEMLVCQHGGELVGLVGGSVVATGTFDVAGAPDRVIHEGETVLPLDVGALYAQIQSGARLAAVR